MFVHDAFDDAGTHDVGNHVVGPHDPGITDPSADHDDAGLVPGPLELLDAADPGSATTGSAEDPVTDLDGPAAELVLSGPDGVPVDLGPAQVSSTGEGGPMDTVTAVSDDGSSVGVYTDTDGDGTVDQIIDVHRDGSFILYLQDDDGTWSVGRTGHIDEAGAVVSDPGVDPAAAGSQPAAFDEQDPADQDPADQDPDDESPEGPQITVPGAAGTGFSGAATYDATGDGTNDTVVVQAEDGSVTTATDYDGDGVADQITVVRPDGTVTVAAADQHGSWATVASGHITEDGGVVFDGPRRRRRAALRRRR